MKNSEFAFGTRFRDAVRSFTALKIAESRPKPTLATVASLTPDGKMANVIMNCEQVPIGIKIGVYKPQPGSIVLVDGPANGRYVRAVSGPVQMDGIVPRSATGATGGPPSGVDVGGGIAIQGAQGPPGPDAGPGPTGFSGPPGQMETPTRWIEGQGTQFYVGPKGGITPGANLGDATWTINGTPKDYINSTPVAGQDLTGSDYVLASTSSTANSSTGWFSNSNACQNMGNGSGRGGFILVFQFGFLDLPAGCRWFAGLRRYFSNSFFSTEPSTHSQQVGVCKDSTDSHPYFTHNDGTQITTLAGVKSSATSNNTAVGQLYEVRLFASPNSTGINMTFEQFQGGTSVDFSTYSTSTRLPTFGGAGLEGFKPFLAIQNNATVTGVASLGIRSVFGQYAPFV